jgi:hypothetical protein
MTVDTDGTGWEHLKRGQPADEVDGVPDDATVWDCIERTPDSGDPKTITIYDAGDTAHVRVYHAGVEVVPARATHPTTDAAREHAERLLAYYTPDQLVDDIDGVNEAIIVD